MFQIKDFASIAASVLNYAKAVQQRTTDFSIGSIARTMLEAPAVEIEELYQQMFIGLREAIPVAIYNSFDFTRLAALPSTGLIRVSITPTTAITLIPAGTIFTSPAYSVSFVSLYDATIGIGSSYVDVTVEAKLPGVIGNISSGTTFTSTPAVQNIISQIALSSFTSGRDEENDAQRKSRFSAYILTLNHGTVAALDYGLRLANVRDINGNIIESVRHTAIIEPYITDISAPIALVNCYIHNGISGASSDLINAANKIMMGYTDSSGNIISGYKAAGVHVTIAAASSIATNIVGVVTIASGHDVATTKLSVQSAIADYINALNIGDNVLIAEIIAAAMGVVGVTNFALTTPSADVVISNIQKAVMGSFTA